MQNVLTGLNTFCMKTGNTFFMFLNFGVSFMILGLVDPSIVSSLGKVKTLKKKLSKRQPLLSGNWVLVEETVYFQNHEMFNSCQA